MTDSVSVPSYALFDTPIGSCGIAWSGNGIVALQLPEADERATRARMTKLLPSAAEAEPPAQLREAIAAITDLLSGKPADLSALPLDMQAVPPFHRRVYEAARDIPPGGTLSYGAIATEIGSPGAARAVGQALGRNPFAIIVPCHRVVAANGKLGGFSANGGVTTKARLLALETPNPTASSADSSPRTTTNVTRSREAAQVSTLQSEKTKKTASSAKKGATSKTAGSPAKAKAAANGAAAKKGTTGKASAGKTAANGAAATGKAAANSAAATGKAAASGAAAKKSTAGKAGAGKAADYEFSPKTALAHLRKADPKLGKFIDGAGPFDMIINPADSVFGMLAEAIIYQQLTAKAASTIFGRVCEVTSGGKRPKPKDVLATSEEKLRGAGLSNAKTRALLDLAEKAESGELPTLAKIKQLPDDEIIETLVKVRGVGRWTAEMFLIFRLGRPDVLPLDDYGLRRGYSLVFGTKDLPSKEELTKAGEKWAPYRTAASWYLWKAAEPPGLTS